MLFAAAFILALDAGYVIASGGDGLGRTFYAETIHRLGALIGIDATSNTTLATAGTLRGPTLVSGGTADQAGTDLTIATGSGKGSGTPPKITLQTAPIGTTGTALNAATTTFAFGYDTDAGAVMANVVGSTVQTTDATVTPCLVLSPASGKAVFYDVQVVGRKDGTDSAAYALRIGVNNNAGTVSEMAADGKASFETAGAAAWDAGGVPNGATEEIRVTGAAATTITWRCKVTQATVSP